MPNTADIAAQAPLTPEEVADRVGVTPTSDMRPFVVEAVRFARASDVALRLAAIEPQAVAIEVCTWCKGTGAEADYVGYDMKCVPVDCSKCNGTGSVPASDERAVEAEPALSIARAAANEMLAANTQWRLDPKYILTICDALEAALAAVPKAQPVQGWQTMDSAPKDEEVLIAYWRWRNSVSTGSIVVQSASQTQFHGDDIWSWVVSDNKHGPFPIRGWSDGDMIGWMPLPAGPSSKETAK